MLTLMLLGAFIMVLVDRLIAYINGEKFIETTTSGLISSGAILTVSSGSEITVHGDMTIQNGATFNNMGVITVEGNLDIQN